MGAMVSQIASLTIVYFSVYSVTDQRKHQSSAPLAFVRGINRGPVNSPHRWPVTRKMFQFDDVIILCLVFVDMTSVFYCSVAVLIHNVTRNVFVFVRQFRPGKENARWYFMETCLPANLVMPQIIQSIQWFEWFTNGGRNKMAAIL